MVDQEVSAGRRTTPNPERFRYRTRSVHANPGAPRPQIKQRRAARGGAADDSRGRHVAAPRCLQRRPRRPPPRLALHPLPGPNPPDRIRLFNIRPF
ncbi:Protein of unknown function [Gryllus bimaculatus]|nr:Protein of unknown function [Gryllus bimaculatus]